jgi:hypothetical protein
MAKPIRATPTLTGEEAVRFLQKMKRKESAKLTKNEMMLMEIMKRNERLFSA